VQFAGELHSLHLDEGRAHRGGRSTLSIEERYRTKDAYLATFKKAANDLVTKRFLLPDDADALVKSAVTEGVRNAP
jgi:Alpha/beta hydrolase domain